MSEVRRSTSVSCLDVPGFDEPVLPFSGLVRRSGGLEPRRSADMTEFATVLWLVIPKNECAGIDSISKHHEAGHSPSYHAAARKVVSRLGKNSQFPVRIGFSSISLEEKGLGGMQ